MGHGRPFKLTMFALVGASALVMASPASTAEWSVGRGEYKGNGGGHHIHFTVEGHKVLDFRVGGAHFFRETNFSHRSFGTHQHGRTTTGDWCDENHLKGYWTRQAHGRTFKIPYHAHRIHHGDEGHRCP